MTRGPPGAGKKEKQQWGGEIAFFLLEKDFAKSIACRGGGPS